jgi:hypothetical protein
MNSFSVRSIDAVDSNDTQSKLNKGVAIDKGNPSAIANSGDKNINFDFSKGETKALVSPPMTENSKLSNDADSLTALRAELAMLRDYRMQTEINKHSEYLQAHGGNTVEALNDNFKREPIDFVWAQEKEKLINSLMEQSEHLLTLPHMAGECRSKQCKLSVLSDDQFYLDKLSNSLDKIIADHGESFSSYSTIIDENSHTTSVYLDRN